MVGGGGGGGRDRESESGEMRQGVISTAERSGNEMMKVGVIMKVMRRLGLN